MASIQYAEGQSRPTECWDVSSLTLDALPQLVPPFEAACQGHRARWRLDGTPRTARQFRVDTHGPLPTPEDRRFCLLTYLKTSSLQVLHGRLFGLGQSKANQWLHVLLPVLLAALRTLGDAPTRLLATLAQRLGVSAADAATVVAPLEEAAAPGGAAPVVTPASPLVPMTGRNDVSSAPRTLLNSKRVRAAKNKEHTVKNVL